MKHYVIGIGAKELVDKVEHKYLYTYNVYRVLLGFIYYPVWSAFNINPVLAYNACENWIRNNNGLNITK